MNTFMRRPVLSLALLVATFLAGPISAGGRVYASAEEAEPLAVGSRVPAVTVRGVAGEEADLAQLVAEQGALLVFYRGGW